MSEWFLENPGSGYLCLFIGPPFDEWTDTGDSNVQEDVLVLLKKLAI